MIKLRKILAPALAAAFASSAAAAEPAADFTRGFDLGAAMEAAAPAPEASPARLQFFNKLRATKGCRFVSFKAGDPAVSAPVTLTSHVFETVCEQYQDGRHCYEKLLRRGRRKVTVELTGDRTPLPWEREVFGVCLEDTTVTAEVVEASHDYEIIEKPGLPVYRVEARAKRRIAGAPDPSGLTAGSWEVPTGAVAPRLELKDKWASFYGTAPGAERTVIKVTLKQDNPLWFDGVILEKELELPPAALYSLDFSGYAAEFRRPLEPGRQYYVKWGFSRKGAISKGAFINGGETTRIVLPLR